MTPHKPTINHIGPGVVTHDQACAICHSRPAVFRCNDAIFTPCWVCQETWEVRRKDWLTRVYERMFGKTDSAVARVEGER